MPETFASYMARGKLEIDTSQAQQAPAVMQGVAAGINSAMANVNASANKAQAGVNGFAGAVRQLAGSFGVSLSIGGAVQIARMGIELARNAAEAERTKIQYGVLAAGVGESADKMLDSMKRASRGMISDQELIVSANKAMLLGVADTSGELDKLLNASRVLGQAMGMDVGQAFNDLVIGLGRLSPRILDNLGIANEGEQMFDNYARALGRTADSLSDAEKKQILLNKVMAAAQPLLDEEAKRSGTGADKFNQFGTSVQNAGQAVGDAINVFGELPGTLGSISWALDGTVVGLKAATEWWGNMTSAAREFMGLGGGSASGVSNWSRPSYMTPGAAPGMADPRIAAAKLDWSKGVEDINAQLHDDIIDEEKSYGRQRADAIRDYQKSTSREAADFAISRQRQEQELLDSIERIHRDSGRREQRMAEDLARSIARSQEDSAERIADARKDHDKRLEELEETYQKSRERATEDHRDRMLSAAGRLDAVALLEERKRWNRESKDASEAHDKQRQELQEQLDERIADENESLEKSIKQAKEAHERQLADAREADAQRIEDMKTDNDKRIEQEDYDRGVRLNRQAEDHNDQLKELDRTHGERLAQINIHAAEERTALDNAHKEEMIALGVRNDAWLKELERFEKARKKIYDDVWGPNAKTGHPSEADPYAGMPGYAAGGLVRNTGLALVHAGEMVIPRQATSTMMAGANNSRSFSVGTFAPTIVLGDIGNRSNDELKMLIRDSFDEYLEEMARGY